MAIYHCSLRVFSRERGHSAVAAAAYRSGQKLTDERTGVVHRYEKRRGVVNSQILLPPQTSNQFQERLALWNAAEAAETRKNSRVAREVIIALPYELDARQRESLARDMAVYLVEKYRVAVDLAVHTPVDESGHDPRNHHAHLLFTTRELTSDGLGAKTRILDDKITGPQQIEIIREVWETLANDALKRAGHSDVRIDRRTLESQGIERIPQIHEGKASTYADELNKSSREQEGDGDDTEEEGDTETGKTEGKKSGSGDQGKLSPDMLPKEEIEPKGGDGSKEEETKRPPPEGKEKSRSECNAEIKALNEQRKEYTETPLKLQIEEIEREIDAIDRRVDRLQVMLDKTSLPQKIQRLIGDVVVKAKEFLAIRTESQTKRHLNEAEKSERHERQLARYGRTFREGIHSQIIEMKDKLETLHSREIEHKKYRAFVTMIETEVMKIKVAPKLEISHPRQEVPVVNSKAPVPVTKPNEQVSRAATKASDEAAQVKAKVPDEYKPSPKADRLQTAFENPQKQPSSLPASGAEKPTPVRSSTASNLLQDTGKHDAPKLAKGKEEILVSRAGKLQSYKIEANEQTKKMLGKIHSELKQIKAQEQKIAKEKPAASGKDAGLKEKFRKPEPPPVKAADVIAKAKASAEKVRQSIPPEFKARPYMAEELQPKPAVQVKEASLPKDEGLLDKFRKQWRQEKEQVVVEPVLQSAAPEPPSPLRKPMSFSFNQAATNAAVQTPVVEMEQSPKL